MNLVEKLMKIDQKKFSEVATKALPSKMLSELMGEEATITIQAIDEEHYVNLQASVLDKKGNAQYDKTYSVSTKVVAACMIEPNLKDEGLLKHMGVATPAEAAKKIFKGEIPHIAAAIGELMGFRDEEDIEDEVKN